MDVYKQQRCRIEYKTYQVESQINRTLQNNSRFVAIISILFFHSFTKLGSIVCQTVDPAAPNLSLPKFVDELPDMPHVQGYHEKDGKLKPATLTIGMYATTWVIISTSRLLV